MKSENPLSTYCDSEDNQRPRWSWLADEQISLSRPGSIYDAIPVPTRESWTDTSRRANCIPVREGSICQRAADERS